VTGLFVFPVFLMVTSIEIVSPMSASVVYVAFRTSSVHGVGVGAGVGRSVGATVGGRVA